MFREKRQEKEVLGLPEVKCASIYASAGAHLWHTYVLCINTYIHELYAYEHTYVSVCLHCVAYAYMCLYLHICKDEPNFIGVGRHAPLPTQFRTLNTCVHISIQLDLNVYICTPSLLYEGFVHIMCISRHMPF